MDKDYFLNFHSLSSSPELAAAVAYVGGRNNSTDTSHCIASLNSPSNFPIMGNFAKEKLPNFGNSMPVNRNSLAISADPSFGNSIFNARTRQLGQNNTELPSRYSPLMAIAKFAAVSSNPSLRADRSPSDEQENHNYTQIQMGMGSENVSNANFSEVLKASGSNRTEFTSSNVGSSVSEPIPGGDIGMRIPDDSNSRKRKSIFREKPTKVAEAEDEDNVNETDSAKMEETKANQKPNEPQKDYIHVRARRGQATDSHSLAERLRREKIGERMKLLQDLVPGCNKITGKTPMLDEIINYVQSLQRQVEFLSMKLATVNPRLEFNTDGYPHVSFPHQELPLTQCSLVDELCGLPQFPTLCGDDLQSIVDMGFAHDTNRDMGFHSQNFSEAQVRHPTSKSNCDNEADVYTEREFDSNFQQAFIFHPHCTA